MKRVILIFAALALFALASIPPPSSAAPAEWSRSYFSEKIRVAARDMQDAKTVLVAKDQSEWSEAEVEKYLQTALFVVHYGLKMYIDINGRQPSSANDLRLSGCINESDWPGNPFNNWEPVSWTGFGGEFRAGELVFQPCGPDLYSDADNPVPKTYALTIFGPSEDYLPVNPPPRIFDWVQIPDGTAFIAGARWTTAAKHREQREKQEKAKQEQGTGTEQQ